MFSSMVGKREKRKHPLPRNSGHASGKCRRFPGTDVGSRFRCRACDDDKFPALRFPMKSIFSPNPNSKVFNKAGVSSILSPTESIPAWKYDSRAGSKV